MKITNIALGFFTAAAIFAAGCTANQTVSEESLGLRKTNLYTEDTTVGDKTVYNSKMAGESKLIERAFENAPPMIPHSVDGMIPITINNNSCTGCHVPGVAESMNATPIPKSHFTDFRPDTSLAKDGSIVKNGKIVDNTSDLKTSSKSLDKLSGTRFNCTLCHAPQSMETTAPANVFQGDFRSEGLNSKSNLIDNINEGVK